MTSIDQRIHLIERNTTEIVTRQELLDLLEEKKTPVSYCGYEVSGPIHLGTLIAINKQLDFLNAGCKVIVLLADLHTHLNRKGDEQFIEEMVEYWRNSLMALGLKKAKFVLGTEFELGADYVYDVLDLGLLTNLKRAVRSMQEIARDIEHARVSQMIYPLMQIADIKALGVDIACGGMEQRKIHMLARELLPSINYRKPVCVHTPLLCSLQGPGSKMSSSKPETMVRINDSPDEIRKKVNNAYCSPEVEGNPILEICRYLIFPGTGSLEVKRPEKFGGDIVFDSYPELEKAYMEKRLHAMDLKNTVAGNLIEMLEPVRDNVG